MSAEIQRNLIIEFDGRSTTGTETESATFLKCISFKYCIPFKQLQYDRFYSVSVESAVRGLFFVAVVYT